MELIASKNAQIEAARESKSMVPIIAHAANSHYMPHANLSAAYACRNNVRDHAGNQHDDGIKRAHSSFCIECSTARHEGPENLQLTCGGQQLIQIGVERKHSVGARPPGHGHGDEAPLRNAKSCMPVLADGECDDTTQAPSSASLEQKQCSCSECAASEANRGAPIRRRPTGQCRCSRDTTSFTSSFTGSSFASVSNPTLSVTPSTFSLTADRHQQTLIAEGRVAASAARPPPAPSSHHYSSSKTNSTSTSSARAPQPLQPQSPPAEGERRSSNVFAVPTSPVSKQFGVGVSKTSLPDSAFISLSSKTIVRKPDPTSFPTIDPSAYTLEILGATPSRAPPPAPPTPVSVPKPVGAKPMPVLRARSPQIADPIDEMLFWQEVLPELNARAARGGSSEAPPTPAAARAKALANQSSTTTASVSSGVTNSLNDSALTSTDSEAPASSSQKEHSTRKRLSFLPKLRRHKTDKSKASTSNSTQHH